MKEEEAVAESRPNGGGGSGGGGILSCRLCQTPSEKSRQIPPLCWGTLLSILCGGVLHGKLAHTLYATFS